MNWGVGITIAIAGFMAFILSMVFKANTKQTELYAEDYYEQEINFQKDISARQKGKRYQENIQLEIRNNQVLLVLEDSTLSITNGTITFYRPDNAKLDKQFNLSLSNQTQAFPLSDFVTGLYQVKLNWDRNNQPHQVNTTIYINKL